MEKMNNDYEIDIEYKNYDIENADTQCPICGKLRFYYKYYCEQDIFLCVDCGYWQEI